jgi:hypothetical protein
MNGCHNREPLRDYVVVQDGWNNDPTTQTRSARMVMIKDPMTKDCQYTLSDLGKADPKCAGCKWRIE